MLGNEDRMKISTKGRYAVRVMLDLALNNNGECIKVKEIAARQGISEKYLEQIIAVLNKAGYVKSVRGAQGGYRIAKDPADFTVGMILRLTEGSLAPVACLEEGADICERCDTWETLEVWQELYDAVNKVVDGLLHIKIGIIEDNNAARQEILPGCFLGLQRMKGGHSCRKC